MERQPCTIVGLSDAVTEGEKVIREAVLEITGQQRQVKLSVSQQFQKLLSNLYSGRHGGIVDVKSIVRIEGLEENCYLAL